MDEKNTSIQDTESTSNKNNISAVDDEQLENLFDTENSTIFTNVHADSKIKAKDNDGKGGISFKQNKFIKGISVLVAVAVLLTGSLFAMKYLWPVSDNSNTEQTTSSQSINLTASANVPLKDMKNVKDGAFSNVSSVKINNSNGSLEIVPNKISKLDSDGDGTEETESVQYKLVGYKNIPQNYSTISSVVENILNVTAVSQLKGEWTDKDCGLDKPEISVDVTMADNSTFNLKLGNKAPSGNNYYYAKTSLLDGIYLVNSDCFDSFNTTVLDYVDTSLISILTMADINDDSYFSDATLVKFDSIKISGENVGAPISLSYKSGTAESMIYRITEPVSTFAGDEQINSILSPFINGMSANAAVVINPDNDDLKKYGLVNPYFEISYKIKDISHTVKFSKPDLSIKGYYNCIIDDVPVIYNVMMDLYEFIEWDLEDIRSNILYSRKIQTINKMTVTFNNKSTVYDISYDKLKEEETTTSDKTGTTASEEDSYEVNVISNAEQIDVESFQTIYRNLILVSASDYLDENENVPNGKSVLTIKCENTDKSVEEIKFIKYNERYYSYTINGIGDSLIKYSTVDDLIKQFTALQKGEKVE